MLPNPHEYRNMLTPSRYRANSWNSLKSSFAHDFPISTSTSGTAKELSGHDILSIGSQTTQATLLDLLIVTILTSLVSSHDKNWKVEENTMGGSSTTPTFIPYVPCSNEDGD